jgi:MoaA/NifB/PqqE/SkfB family radical SAM enzyme
MSTYCSLPWIHLATHPDGGATLCCVSDHRNAASRARNFEPLQYLDVNNNTIDSIMNSDYYKQTRLEMLNNQIPHACQRCYQEEANGVRSKRVEENERLGFTEDIARAITQDDGTIPVNFKFVELRLGNLCNLKCRTCNPMSSTNWIQPYQKLQEELKFVTHYDRKINSSWTESDEFWDDLFKHSEDLQLIYVNGGEPTLVEKHWKYLEELIKRGLNKQITLWYNINMTNLPDKLIELWKEFKRVQVTCSIDDLGERNDYIRAGSEWNTVISNLDKIQSYPWIEASICQTVGWMNVYYVNDFIKYMRSRNLHVHLNYVYDPEFLSIKALPGHLKQVILDRCTDLNEWELNSLRSQFAEPIDMTLYQQGLQYNNWLDNNNRTSFANVFPEWHDLLKICHINYKIGSTQ